MRKAEEGYVIKRWHLAFQLPLFTTDVKIKQALISMALIIWLSKLTICPVTRFVNIRSH